MSLLTPYLRPDATREFTHIPGLNSLYTQALLPDPQRVFTAARTKLSRQSSSPVLEAPQLPDVTHVARNVCVPPEKLKAYQHLVGEPIDGSVPAGFIHVLGFPLAMSVMASSDFPLPLVGMIHLENRINVARAIGVDEHFDFFAWTQNIGGHPKGTTVEVVVEAYVDEKLVWQGVSVYLAPGKFLAGLGEEQAREAFQPPLPTAAWDLTGNIGREYASVSGDRNPIHMSALTAKVFGFPRAIAHGMYIAARALAQSRDVRGDEFTWTVTFAKPVLLPSKVFVSLRQAAPLPSDDHSSPKPTHLRIDPRNAAVQQYGWNPKTGKLHFKGSISPL
ncbi:MaoC family dehydratase [Timonella sp. A28]|uniref:MaoC family dehydratase n=1 Tax=Timonella sp. A28 TaxID=3442640 RepID=UPI003EB72B7E